MTDHTNERQAAFGQVIQFQARNELHRAFASPPDTRERMSWLEAAGVALAFILAAAIVIALIAWGWQELRHLDLSPLAMINWKPS